MMKRMAVKGSAGQGPWKQQRCTLKGKGLDWNESNVSKKHLFSHFRGSSLVRCGCCFYAPVLHGEWLSSKPWDSVSARKNVSALNVTDWMSNFEIRQTQSLKKTILNINSYCKTIQKRLNWNSRMLCCRAWISNNEKEAQNETRNIHKGNELNWGITERCSRANWGVQEKRGKEKRKHDIIQNDSAW